MATLLQLRTALNGEIGVLTDAEATPWTVAVRNQAISDGYKALWTAGVWKDLVVDSATVDDQWVYTLSSMRRLQRLELLDSSWIGSRPRGIVEENGSGGYHLRLVTPLGAGFTLRARGWGPYVHTFASDAAVDDLPAEYTRIPLLKAKAILFRAELARFMRTNERQNNPPAMNVTIDQLLAMVAAAEREFETESGAVAGMRSRAGQTRRL